MGRPKRPRGHGGRWRCDGRRDTILVKGLSPAKMRLMITSALTNGGEARPSMTPDGPQKRTSCPRSEASESLRSPHVKCPIGITVWPKKEHARGPSGVESKTIE